VSAFQILSFRSPSQISNAQFVIRSLPFVNLPSAIYAHVRLTLPSGFGLRISFVIRHSSFLRPPSTIPPPSEKPNTNQMSGRGAKRRGGPRHLAEGVGISALE